MSSDGSSDEDIPGLESVSSSEVGSEMAVPLSDLFLANHYFDLLRMCRKLFGQRSVARSASTGLMYMGGSVAVP